MITWLPTPIMSSRLTMQGTPSHVITRTVEDRWENLDGQHRYHSSCLDYVTTTSGQSDSRPVDGVHLLTTEPDGSGHAAGSHVNLPRIRA